MLLGSLAGAGAGERAGGTACRTDLSAVALQLAAALRGPAASSRPLGTRLHPVAVHGNYRRYYGYRLDRAFGTDPRLQARCSFVPRIRFVWVQGLEIRCRGW